MSRRQPQEPIGDAVVFGTPRRNVPKTGLGDGKNFTRHTN
jgi:hypothetical protein